MLTKSVPHQSSCHQLLVRHVVVAVIAIAGLALVMLANFNAEPVTAWSPPGLAAESNISWSTADAGEASGLIRYEISTDSSIEVQAPLRFVF